MSLKNVLPGLVLGALLAGCAATGVEGCSRGEQLMTSDWLYMGTQTPDGVVSAADWQSFLDDAVTPRFPQGLSTWPVAGQWRNSTGLTVREASHVLHIVHPARAADDRAITDIAAAYKTRFRQESVLRVRSTACVLFQ